MIEKKHFESPLPHWIASSLPAAQISSVYEFFVNRRNIDYSVNPDKSYKAPFPVISIGGIRAGGTGKTPAALLVGRMALEMDFNIAFLSRGYKRTNKNVFIAKPLEKVSWHDCGDEPAMLHEAIPQSWLGIGADRSACAGIISKSLPVNSVFILDDGFQHRSIKRDLDIVCVSESLYTDRMIPSGYLREPVASLSRAQVVFIIGSISNIDTLTDLQKKIRTQFPDSDCYTLTQEPDCWVSMADGKRSDTLPLNAPLAICGIARPERFFATVRSMGIKPCRELIFPDHHRFTINDICNTHELYSNGLILTEKDALRISEFSSEICSRIWYLKIKLKFLNDDMEIGFKKKLRSFLSNKIV